MKLIALRVDEKTFALLESAKNKSAYVREAIKAKANPGLFSSLKPFLGHAVATINLGNGSSIVGFADTIDDPVALNKHVKSLKIGGGAIDIVLE